MKKSTKRYLISSAVTFGAVFAGSLLLNIDNIELSSFTDGVAVAVLFTALRAGVKAVLELIVIKYGKQFRKTN